MGIHVLLHLKSLEAVYAYPLGFPHFANMRKHVISGNLLSGPWNLNLAYICLVVT